jgi:hypothetical protein
MDESGTCQGTKQRYKLRRKMSELDNLRSELEAARFQIAALERQREEDFHWIASAQLDLLCLIEALEKVDPSPKDPRENRF